MTAWWTSLDLMMKILWGITIASSLIFVIQSVMTFLGADAGGDFDMDTDFGGAGDADLGGGPGEVGGDVAAGGLGETGGSGDGDALGGDGMSLLTFRNFVNFFLGFGWATVLMKDSFKSTTLLLVFGVVVGITLVAAVMYLYKWLGAMQQSGNINVYKSAVGCQGKVYLTIPAERSGEGKVQITINNSVREYTAFTDGDLLKTGTPIRVSEVLSPSTLLVEPLESYIV